MYLCRTKKYFVKLYKRYYMFNLLLMHFPVLSSSILCQNPLLSPIVLYHPTLYHGHFLQFACCYVTRWGKFGRVFCKQTSVAACRFQNECNKVEIALRVVQFWSEVKLVITNRTPASRSCDFVITRLISDQIALHSVQLPL